MTPIYDLGLSFVASSDDPISGGRHKVIGSKKLNMPPQTSTIASHLPKAVGAAFSIDRAKNLKIKQIIITSTSEVYGSSLNGKLKEIDELKAQSPYSASKIAADQLSLSFFRSLIEAFIVATFTLAL